MGHISLACIQLPRSKWSRCTKTACYQDKAALDAVVIRAVEADLVLLSIREDPELIVEVAPVELRAWDSQLEIQHPIGDHPGDGRKRVARQRLRHVRKLCLEPHIQKRIGPGRIPGLQRLPIRGVKDWACHPARPPTVAGECGHAFRCDPKPPRAEVADAPVIQDRLAQKGHEQICNEVCRRRIQHGWDF